MADELHPDAIEALVNAEHGAPFDLLGAHVVAGGVSVRAFCPNIWALSVVNEADGSVTPMRRLHDDGFFEVTLPVESLTYHFVAVEIDGSERAFSDPYAFAPVLTDFDLHLFNEGRHYTSYEKLGAHPHEIDGVAGVHFAVWAPNAYRVSVIGDFNAWNAAAHPMRLLGESGIWALFIPNVSVGAVYRYDLRSRFDGYYAQKSDPYAFAAEVRPANASVVADLTYTWDDAAWMAKREQVNSLDAPMSIYEVHLGSWRYDSAGNWLSYRELAHQLVAYALDMGYTHLELMPIAEHPLDASWGYQITGYFAPTSRFGSPTDFMYFVDYCHQNGLGVILDWVPAHFPKDGHGLAYFDGSYLYEHADPRRSEHPDWGTRIFNYGRNEVRNFLIANALFWLKVYHIDGLRVDAVSSMLYLDFSRKEGEWLPNEHGGNENLEAIDFLKALNEIIHAEAPGAVTIAEESTSWAMVSRPTYLGGLGFTFKWDMGWMHDTLKYMAHDPLYRRYVHHQITFSMAYFFSENFVLSLSHDEVVHGKGSLIGKMQGDWYQQFASLRLLFGYQYTHPGKKLNFMGQEFAQWREWSEARALDWNLLDWETHRGIQNWIRDLNRLYVSEAALFELDYDLEGFRWIEANDAEQSVYSYVRFARDHDDFVVVVMNATPVVRDGYRIGVPVAGRYVELLNSDSAHYGGANDGNQGEIVTEPVVWHDWDQSVNLRLPPLSVLILKRVDG